MPKVIFVEPNGTEHEVHAPIGMNVMHAAIRNSVPGIDADCGGNCACSTCHVFIDETWLEAAGRASGMEEDILDFALDTKETSRLSCQIEMTQALDGLRLHIPEWQR
ncbi:MAG: 2Fe-2S iron-sulfur cluster binding domain-containing protein [Parvibaculum sp.]|nr:2Fe-2S iron-sulfur cluster binding domain-containing protein [Parvibaculum sp.]